MKALIASLFAALSMAQAVAGDREDFNQGLAAAKRQDYAGAFNFWKPLAERGHVLAQYNLAEMYSNGYGDLPQDYSEAERWLSLAAAQNLVHAQFKLGWMYFQGLGGRIDYAKAAMWFKLAAKKGHASAQNNLAIMFEAGWGVPQDDVKAHLWFDLAALNGAPNAAAIRNSIAKSMIPQQIAIAQKMARECLASNYKNCD
jgi:TPR repeat protein